ncbi:hypothetical protein R3P38DRAFT_2785727 [Favolaschia claudopus]|uniref:Ribosome biogenesis protein SLX9 n=1 Tax=Favolaschia claudopus TaxID=2862362 RepID=A0AAW0AV53_9AGAR
MLSSLLTILSLDLLPGRTHLAPASIYQPLFLEDAALKRARRPTFTFHADKEMWQHKKLPGVTAFSDEARQSMLFKSIVTSSQKERFMRGLNRKSSKLEVHGKGKRARSQKENKALDKTLKTLKAGYERVKGDEDGESGGEDEEIPVKPKRRRLTADQRIALQNI